MSATDNDMEIDVLDLGTVAVLVPRLTYLNYVSSDEVKSHMKQLCATSIAGGAKTIVLDLTNVGIVDSCGLSLLIGLKKTVDGQSARFALCCLSPVIQRLFEITKLDRAFAIFPDQASAARDAV
jgi:anti-sigma B factor antagonist